MGIGVQSRHSVFMLGDVPVTLSVQGVPLEHLLQILLRPIRLTYRIDGDKFVITTQDEK